MYIELKVTFAILHVLIALEGVNCNTAVLKTIIQHRSLHTSQYIFVVHLLIADLLVSMVVSPFSVLVLFDLEIAYDKCACMITVILTLNLTPNYILFCVTFDRYLVVRYPLKYCGTMSFTLANEICIGMWVISLSIVQIPHFIFLKDEASYRNVCNMDVYPHEYIVYFSSTMVCLSYFLLIGVYTYIYNQVKRHRLHSDTLERQFHIKIIKNKPKHIYVKLLIAYGCMWLPLLVLGFMHAFGLHNHDTHQLYTRDIVFEMALIMERLSVIVNPFLYTNGNKQIKNSLRKAHFMETTAEFNMSIPTTPCNTVRTSFSPDLLGYKQYSVESFGQLTISSGYNVRLDTQDTTSHDVISNMTSFDVTTGTNK